MVVVLDAIEGERVLEARATAAANGDAKCLVARCPPGRRSSSPIFSAALSLRVIASVVVSVTSQSVASGLRESRALSSSAQTAVVCDTTAYLPDAARRRSGASSGSASTSRSTADQEPRARSPISPTSTSGCAPPKAARPPRSRRSATSSPSTSRCSTPAAKSSRSTSRPGSPGPSRPPTRPASGSSRKARAASGSTSSTRARRPAGWASACWPPPPRRRAGGDAEAVLARAEQAREELKMWFAIDTLEYLRRGGRIGGARAWIGSALKIKPILTLEEEITPIERVRTRARSIERLRDYARKHHEDGYDAWVVQHIQDFETADALVEDAREIFGCEPAFVSEIGAVLGAHVGPGLLGIGSVSKSVLGVAARRRRYLRRRSIIRPPTAKPTTAAPTIELRSCSRTWRRQSVSSVTRCGAPRPSCRGPGAGRRCRRGSEPACGRAGRSSAARAAMRLGGLVGAHFSAPAAGRRAPGVAQSRRDRRRRGGRRLVAFDRRPDQLRLLDRLLGHRRGAGLDAPCRRTSRRRRRPAGRSPPRRRSRPRSCRRPLR